MNGERGGDYLYHRNPIAPVGCDRLDRRYVPSHEASPAIPSNACTSAAPNALGVNAKGWIRIRLD